MKAYTGKLLFVDLAKGACEDRSLSEELARKYIGGYGIGARFLYDMMKPGADALGPGNILGFVTGPLNATGALFGGRYMVVCKSPVTGGWNDANSGGFFGPELKKAGYDAVFVSGAAKTPVYLLISEGKAEIRDARALWGKDCVETENALKEETGEPKLRAAVIGPAGERLSLMACVINDLHRAAGRGGPGAVMGSKNLKAVAVRGTGSVPVANQEAIKRTNAEILAFIKNGPTAEILKGLGAFGTGGATGGSGLSGDSPVKNWGGVGSIDMGEGPLTGLATFSYDGKYNSGKYACASCPLGCGAHYNVSEGKWPVGKTDRPEYETIAAFGTMALNGDIESVIKCNDICNRYGLDTISVGATVVWAIECYENGLITEKEAGMPLKWGDAASIVAITEAIALQEGFGKLLALGSAKAAERLGKGGQFLQTVRGIELPMHDPRFSPGLARTYQCDPTPGRHVKGGLGLPEMMAPPEVKYTYDGKGMMDLGATCRTEVLNAAGLCLLGADMGMPPDGPAKLLSAATGWEISPEELMVAGKRILNMRHLFNLREGLRPGGSSLPKRAVGEPPLTSGPLAGVTVDHQKLTEGFFDAMGWDRESGVPRTE